MLIQPQYEGFYGSVGRVGRSSVQTLFYHFGGLPIWPQRTYWVTAGLFTQLSDTEVTELRRDMRSVLVGYARGWVTAGSFYLLCLGVFLATVIEQPLFPYDPMLFGRTILGAIVIGLALGGMVVAIGVWLLTRFPPSEDELARRAVFSRFLGTAVDPASLVEPWSPRDQLMRGMADLAESLGFGRTFDGWPQLLQRPELRAPQYFAMAMTVARLARATERRPERAMPSDDELARLEDLAWQRLCELEPAARRARPG